MKPSTQEPNTIESINQTIENYKSNLFQIITTIEIESKNKDIESIGKVKTLTNLKKDVENAIKYYETILKYKQSELEFNKDPITEDSVNKICSAYFEEEKKWYNAKILSLDETKKTCKISFLGFNEEYELPFTHIKPNKIYPVDNLKNGMNIEAIYNEDGKWYPATIVRVSELGIHIKFNGFPGEEIVQNDYIRITPELEVMNLKLENKKNKKVGDEAKKEEKFEIPEKYKINPTDNEEVRLLKRKRVKQLKNSNKQKKIEKITQEKQQNWINFNKNLHLNKDKNLKAVNGFMPMKIIKK